MEEHLSEVAFNSLPQAIRDWLQELGWKREDIIYCHITHTNNPVLVIARSKKELKEQHFNKLADGEWRKV